MLISCWWVSTAACGGEVDGNAAASPEVGGDSATPDSSLVGSASQDVMALPGVPVELDKPVGSGGVPGLTNASGLDDPELPGTVAGHGAAASTDQARPNGADLGSAALPSGGTGTSVGGQAGLGALASAGANQEESRGAEGDATTPGTVDVTGELGTLASRNPAATNIGALEAPADPGSCLPNEVDHDNRGGVGDSQDSASSAGGSSTGPSAGAWAISGTTEATRPGTVGCGDTPPGGECVSETRVRYCVVQSGEAEPTLFVRDCSANESCQTIATGASCVAVDGACSVSGSSSCEGAQTLHVCNGESWDSTSCPEGCRQTPLGAFCRDSTTTSPYSAVLHYEGRVPDEGYTDWSSDTTESPVQGALVVSYRGEQFIDAALTDPDGAFTVAVPSPSEENDRVFAMLLHPSATGLGYSYAIGVPNVDLGAQSIYRASSPNAGIWNWQLDPIVTPSGSTAVITEALGSGAVRLYDSVRRSYARTEAEFGTAGKSVVVWVRMNTEWQECSACFMSAPALAGSLRFDGQIFIPATADNQSFWSEPLAAHELGHWAMWSYGSSPREGGAHCLGVPTYPGQAWSEGWATGFSSVVRDDPVFYDKQFGTMFWLDLSSRTTLFGAWPRPIPDDGLLQLMDENEVAAMVWGLAAEPGIGASAVFQAIGSPRMHAIPFARGYTRHTWTMSGCALGDSVDSGESSPMIADFLDALVCAGAPPDAVDAVTEPDTHYPYPSRAPLCANP